ncbi:cytochrome P450 315a1, mitochondrial [Aricia agestis]|uniref:cytochrome P450 315a1, mitochondrial n=1 Tax=Aricia agestis TaxID=91739 RepID=UPI001C207794|nr:cytochrome P450 315a1, mitochondrial [Aricia agestis]
MQKCIQTSMKKSLKLRVSRREVTQSTSITIKDMPRPKEIPILGKVINYFKVGGGLRLHEYIDVRHKELGPTFCERLDGNTDMVFTSDPKLMKDLFLGCEGKYPQHILPEPWVLYGKLYGTQRGLFFMDGEEWLRNRKVMNKHFLRDDNETWMNASVEKAVSDFISAWKQKNTPCLVKDLESELYNLSVNVIINVLAGQDCIEFSNHYDELVSIFSNSVKQVFHNTTKLYGLPLKICHQLNFKVWREFKSSVDLSLSLSTKIVKELIKLKNTSNGLVHKLSKDNMSDVDIIKIVSDLIIASGDTTAYTSLWILYLLSKHPNVVEEIRHKDRIYINYVIKEAMRLYPVAPFLTRILSKDTLLGEYFLTEQTPIIASIYTAGRDEQYFSNPNSFLPHRWDRADARKKDLNNHEASAAIPFALGVRSCIGKKLAMLQLNEVLYQVVNNFDLHSNNSEVKAVTSQILMPDEKINLIITSKI